MADNILSPILDRGWFQGSTDISRGDTPIGQALNTPSAFNGPNLSINDPNSSPTFSLGGAGSSASVTPASGIPTPSGTVGSAAPSTWQNFYNAISGQTNPLATGNTGSSGPFGLPSDFLARAVIVILGFIFVAVGLSLFRVPQFIPQQSLAGHAVKALRDRV